MENKIEKLEKRISVLESKNSKLEMMLSHSLKADISFYSSQFGQDIFVDKFFNHKENGVFVELGAYHPVSLSNTYFLEKQRNWSGMLIEAMPDRMQLLKNVRTNSIVESCAVSMDEEDVSFVVSSVNFLSVMKNHLHQKHKDRISQNNQREITVPSFKLQTLLAKHGIKKVDYLSLDVEGGEFEVLRSIDFDNVDITLFTVEIDYPELFGDIHNLFKINNYKLLGRINNFNFTLMDEAKHVGNGDYIFVKNEFRFL